MLPEKRKSIDVSNKTFFSNIKAQLHNIRSDVNKLTLNKDQMPKIHGLNKTATANPKTNGQLNKIKHQDESSTTVNSDLSKKYKEEITELSLKLTKQLQITKQYEEELLRKKQENSYYCRLLEELKKDNEEKSQFIHKLQRECERNVQSFGKQNLNQLKSKLQYQVNEISTKKCQIRALNQVKLNLQRKLEQNCQNYAKSIIEIKNQYENKLSQAENLTNIKKQYEQKLQQLQLLSQKSQQKGQQKNLQASISQYQNKINSYIDENYSLKNKISSLQNLKERDQVKIESLEVTVKAYEKRDQDAGERSFEKQILSLHQKINVLQEENEKLREDYEYEIMKLENQIDEIKQSKIVNGGNNKSVNQIIKDQISEIETLRQQLKEKNQK